MQEARQERLASTGMVEPLRFLMPSPVGGLAIELMGSVVTRLVIEPDEERRAAFTPLHDIDGSDLVDEVCGRLSEYFAGARRKLEIEFDLGPSGVNGFAKRVLKEAAKIPYGRTRTYAEIAEAAGRGDAYRQVLAALLENPIPILIPCHRIVASKSGVGSWVGGGEGKLWLLQLEQESTELI